MTGLWILIMILSTMYTVQTGRRWVTAQSLIESPVYQPDKELSVDIGDSATLRCCISESTIGIIDWFKQLKRKQPQIMVTIYKSAGETFHTGFQDSNFLIERFSNCFNMIILKTNQSDEAMYYCALTRPNLVFGDGTYLKIKETSKPALFNNSVICEETTHGNSTNMNTQEKTVLGLGTALGLCILFIFCLTFLILKRRKSDKTNSLTEDSPGARQESDTETPNYAALKFTKSKAEKRKTVPSDEDSLCVYSDVKKTVRCNINDL
ncbi:uncharacterized protein Hap1MRO34_012113 isoform 2-T2 [Clarias gariepinus]